MGALAIAARERSVQQRGCGGERRTRTDAHGARLRIAMCGPRCGMMRCLHGRTALQSGSAVYANGRTGLREQSTHDHRPNRSTHHDSNGKFDHARSLVLRLRLFGIMEEQKACLDVEAANSRIVDAAAHVSVHFRAAPSGVYGASTVINARSRTSRQARDQPDKTV